MINALARPLTLVAVLALVLAACAPTGTATESPGATTTEPGSSAAVGDCPRAQPEALPAGETRSVALETAKGTITLGLEADLSPIAVGNFVALAECGFYDGVVFHRLVPGFVIQGGDPDGTGTGGPGYTIRDEPLTASYERGTVAMARTPAPDSQGSQFFIVLDDGAALALDQAQFPYAILGRVTEGMDVVDKIAAGPTSGDSATRPVAMRSVTIRR